MNDVQVKIEDVGLANSLALLTCVAAGRYQYLRAANGGCAAPEMIVPNQTVPNSKELLVHSPV
jgi:hypothetical protein